MINKAMAILIEIPESYLNKWQSSINLLPQLFEVSTASIMRMLEDNYEVIVHNQAATDHSNKKQKRFSNCYYDDVIGQGKLIAIEYAPDDPIWCDDFKAANETHSYLGAPIRWHDHTIFGTLNLRNSERRHYSELDKQLFSEFIKSIEQDLKILAHEKVISQQLQQIKEINRNLINARKKNRLTLTRVKNLLNFMSHNIRTSLNGILGAGHLLSDSNSRQDKIQYIESINVSSEMTLTLMGDIMDYSKISEGQLSLNQQAFNLDDLIRDVVDAYQVKFRNIEIVFAGIDDKDKLWFLGDCMRIRQILTNIIGSTIKHSDANSINIERTFTSAKHINIGLSVHRLNTQGLKHLFCEYKPFTSDQNYHDVSTDLSLSVSKKLIDLMQGHVHIESNGTASHLNIELPLTQIISIPKNNNSLEKNYSDQVRPMKILVAEDNLTDQMVIGGFLQKLKQSASYASNGQLAVEKYMQQAQLGNNFELILMDCEMPILDGLTASRKIRAFETKHKLPRCNIVALSAHAMTEFGQQCLDAGMDRHITKPIRLRGLKEILWLVSEYHSPAIPRQNNAN